jgi:hypothetical protein
MDKKAFLRQFISPFIQGENFDAILGALADEAEKQEQLSIAVNDQLTITASSGVYLDKNMSALGIVRPPELGMEDLAFKQMGIQVNAQKQITESIHAILSTFYGDEAVRAHCTSSIAGPYQLADGDDLTFALENDQILTLVISEAEFENIQQATAPELANVITNFIRSFGLNGYAEVIIDPESGLEYVRIYGGAKGPYSYIQILGGRIQNQLEFPIIRDTFLEEGNTTVWEITRNVGSTYRFRWISGPKPKLDQAFVGDNVMIYGQGFQSYGIEGTFEVTKIAPPSTSGFPPLSTVASNAGYFEIEIPDFTALKSSAPDIDPPESNDYRFRVTQSSFDDLKFFLPRKNTPYSQARYALAWEPTSKLLKVYMPATTKVVKRALIGASHLHFLYGKGEFNGSWGSTTEIENKIQIVNDRVVRYKQNGSDAAGFGGTLNSTPIDYIFRENGYTTVVCLEPHGLTGVVDQWNRIISDEIVSVNVANMPEDNPDTPFPGPYIIDPAAPYTLTSFYGTIREKIIGGQIKTTLLAEGNFPSEGGYLLFDLNKETQEGPVTYLNAQSISNLTPVDISTISQVGNTVTVTTIGSHGAIAGENILISNTVNFNGSWTVIGTPSTNVFTFTKFPSATAYETSGTCIPVIENALTTLVLDPSYSFKYSHDSLSDVTVLSDSKAYQPQEDGTDYGVYLTGTADGRIFAEELIRSIVAVGIRLEIIIIYPSDKNLGNMGLGSDIDNPPVSDKVNIWGES